VSAFSTAGEEHVESELGDVLELSFSWRVVDGYQWIIHEAEERFAVIDVVVDGRRQRLGTQEGRSDRGEPALEVADYRANALLAMCKERIAGEIERLRLLFFAVDNTEANYPVSPACSDFGAFRSSPTGRDVQHRVVPTKPGLGQGRLKWFEQVWRRALRVKTSASTALERNVRSNPLFERVAFSSASAFYRFVP
jgi:hypothetical protein